jgi:hypothetical protein
VKQAAAALQQTDLAVGAAQQQPAAVAGHAGGVELATTRREKCWAKANDSWLHSVMRKAVPVRASTSCSTPQLCLKRRPFSTVNYGFRVYYW